MITEEEKEALQEESADAVKEEAAEAELEGVLAEETVEETAEAEEAPEEETEETKKEKAKPSRKKKEEEEDIAEERMYTIPLGRALVRPPKKRAPRAMQLVRAFITRHMKLAATVSDEDEEQELPALVISKEVNEKVWSRGIEKPPRKIRVRATKDIDGNVTVYLAEDT